MSSSSIGMGDTPGLVRARQLRPSQREAERIQQIRQAQNQEYLQSMQEKEGDIQYRLQQLELQEQELRNQQEQLELERREKQVSTFDLMNALLDELAKRLNRLVKLEEDKVPLGKTFPLSFTVSNKLVRIDFVTGKDSYGVPAAAYAILPFCMIRGLTITNDGPGDIAFSTNDYPIDKMKGATVVAHTAAPVNFDQAVIYSLTVGLVSGSSAGIRVVGVY